MTLSPNLNLLLPQTSQLGTLIVMKPTQRMKVMRKPTNQQGARNALVKIRSRILLQIPHHGLAPVNICVIGAHCALVGVPRAVEIQGMSSPAASFIAIIDIVPYKALT